MKILQVLHSFMPYTSAGTEVYTYNLSKELSKRNHVYIFFRIKQLKKEEYALSHDVYKGLETYAVNHTFKRCSSFEETYADKKIDYLFGDLLDRIKPDLVHIQHLLFLSLGMVNEIKKRGIPIVFTLNDYWLFCPRGQLIKGDLTICDGSLTGCKECIRAQLSIKKYSLRWYYRARNVLPNFLLQLLKNCYIFSISALPVRSDWQQDEIQKRLHFIKRVVSAVDIFITPSRFVKKIYLGWGLPEDKILSCSYGIRYEQPSTDSSITEADVVRFGFIGTLLPMKGVDILIRAFKRIRSNNARLLIYGASRPYTGYENYCRQLAQMAAGDERIRLMGEFDNVDIGQKMMNIDVLVVPSIWLENSPLVIQEAFLYKKPIIASRIGGIPEFVSEGVNGLLFTAGDTCELQKKLEYVIKNPDILEFFKTNIPKVKSIEEHVQEIETIYVRLCAAKNYETVSIN